VAGAERYWNPDEDLPGDFEERRAGYCRELGRDTDARAFTTALKSKLTDALTRLNRTIPANPKARILWRCKNRISITPFEALPPAPAVDAIQAELERRWPMTELIDLMTETAARTGFLDTFASSCAAESWIAGALQAGMAASPLPTRGLPGRIGARAARELRNHAAMSRLCFSGRRRISCGADWLARVH
jgi:hypothetical protein